MDSGVAASRPIGGPAGDPSWRTHAVSEIDPHPGRGMPAPWRNAQGHAPPPHRGRRPGRVEGVRKRTIRDPSQPYRRRRGVHVRSARTWPRSRSVCARRHRSSGRMPSLRAAVTTPADSFQTWTRSPSDPSPTAAGSPHSASWGNPRERPSQADMGPPWPDTNPQTARLCASGRPHTALRGPHPGAMASCSSSVRSRPDEQRRPSSARRTNDHALRPRSSDALVSMTVIRQASLRPASRISNRASAGNSALGRILACGGILAG